MNTLRFQMRSAMTLAVAAATVALSGGTNAQSARAGALEEVIVTAERREETLADVPVSLVAMTSSDLEKFDISGIEDFRAKIPNVVVNEYFGIATTFRSFIRGVGAVTVEVTQDPAVALYMDGVYVGSSYGGSFEAADLQRVEILRGPQGSLYGRNATGGAINLISKKPDFEALTFSQSLTFGDYDEFRSKTFLNVPFSDSLAMRLGYFARERDGVVDNLGAGEDFGQVDREGLRVAFRYQPDDRLIFDLSGEYSKIEDTLRYTQTISGAGTSVGGTAGSIAVPLGPPGSPVANVFFPDPVQDDRLDTVNSPYAVQPENNDVLGLTFTAQWELSDSLSLKSLTGYREANSEQFTMVTGTSYALLDIPGVPVQVGPFPLGVTGLYKLDFEQFSQEFQVTGSQQLAAGGLEYVAGLYYYRDEGHNRDESATLQGPRPPGTDTTDTENTSYAVFGQVEFTPGDGPWHFTLGARWSQDKREAVRTNLNAANPFINVDYDNDFDNFSPSLIIAYDFTDSASAYAKVVTGYRSGGTSTLSFEESLFQRGAEEETIVSYELGLKGDFLERRLRVNSALFMMDYDDYQGSIQTGPNPANRDLLNIGSADIYGFELDISAVLAASLTGSLKYGYLDTQFAESSVDPGTGAPPTPLVEELPYAPAHSLSLALDYGVTLGNGWQLSANVSYAYQDESESGIIVGTSRLNDQKGLLDASVSLADIPFLSGRLSAVLWGQNLTDEEYVISNVGSFALFGAAEVSPFGDPRTFGISLTYDYE